MSPGDVPLQYGVPLALISAVGTFLGGYLTQVLTPRSTTAVAWIPAIGVLLAIPLYIWGFYIDPSTMQLVVWGAGAMFHYCLSRRAIHDRAGRCLATLARFGDRDPAVHHRPDRQRPRPADRRRDVRHVHAHADRRRGHGRHADHRASAARKDLSALAVEQQDVCRLAYGEGLRQSMAATVLFFIPAAAFYLLASLTLKKDLVAKPI